MGLFERFPSHDYLIKSAIATFKRFPLAILCAFGATVVAVIQSEMLFDSPDFQLVNLLLTFLIGLPLFVGLKIFYEVQNIKRQISWIIDLIAIVIILIYYLMLPGYVGPVSTYMRFFVLAIGLHFLVAFLPYIKSQPIIGFWQYNKTLFLRILLSALYSAVLYVGLAIALLALDFLFGVEIKPERYYQLWVIIAGIANTLIFLAGIPDNLAAIGDDLHYPKGLKLFAQFVLIPLVVTYFVILIAYEGKILITQNWPSGWVSNLVLWYSVVGILSLLLLYPLRDDKESRWIGIYSKWFYIGMVPLVVMLFIAIIKRISEYGLTEMRYFVFAMAIGLAIAVIYFIISKKKDIRIIPIILCVLAFIAAYGPFSAFSMAKNDQLERLENILTKNNLLQDGLIIKASSTIPGDDERQLSSIVRYLYEWHGLESFEGLIPDSMLAATDSISKLDDYKIITEVIGIKYVTRWGRGEEGRYIWWTIDRDYGFKTSNYDYMIDIESWRRQEDTQNIYILDDDTCYVDFELEQPCLTVSFANSSDTITHSLAEHLIELAESEIEDTLSVDKLTFDESSASFDIRFIIKSIHGNQQTEHDINISRCAGYLFVRRHLNKE